MSLLVADDLTVSATLGGERVPVLQRPRSFTLAPGKILGLVGESGAGKSMVGRTIAQLLPPGFAVTGGSLVVRRRGPRRRCRAARRHALARPRHRLHSAGAAVRAQSGADHRPAVRRASRALGIASPRRAARPRAGDVRGRAPAARRRAAAALSAPAFRRHVPARADRDGVRRQPAPGDRRRADDRARRHDPGAHRATDRRDAAARRTRRCSSSPTTCGSPRRSATISWCSTPAAGRIRSGARSVRAPAHPYTRCLQLANPPMSGARRALQSLPERMPGLRGAGRICPAALSRRAVPLADCGMPAARSRRSTEIGARPPRGVHPERRDARASWRRR